MKLLAAPAPCPFEPAVTWHWQQPVPVRPNWSQTARYPSYVAFHIGINMVQRGRPPVLDCPCEFIKCLGPQVAQRAVIRRHSRLQPGSAHRKSAILTLLDVDYWTMPGECQVNRNRSLPFDFDLLANIMKRLPLALILVLVRVGR